MFWHILMCLIPFMNPARQKPSLIQMEPKPADTRFIQLLKMFMLLLRLTAAGWHLTGRDLAYIDIYLKDENDRINTDSDPKVRVIVKGPEVFSYQNHAPDSEESFCTGMCTTFAGHALAVIRPMAPGSTSCHHRRRGMSGTGYFAEVQKIFETDREIMVVKEIYRENIHECMV